MRILSLITVGVGALAFADAQAACVAPATPLTTTSGKNVCAHPGATAANVVIAANAIIGTDVHVYANVSVGAQADIGDYTQLGSETGVGALVIAPKTLIRDSTSYATRTIIQSGTLGRRDDVGDQTSAGENLVAAADVIIGRNVTLGADVSLGFGATINDNAVLGDDIQLGNLSTVGFGAIIGDNTTVGRSTIIGNYADVCNVVLGPDIKIAAYAHVGDCDANGAPTGPGPAKVRRGAEIGKHADVQGGTRIGRDATVEDYATIEQGATIRSGAIVQEGGVVAADDFIPKCPPDPIPDQDPLTAGIQHPCIVAGNPANVPPEPSGTFFSAAGGKVCVEDTADSPSTADGVCNFRGIDDDMPADGIPDRYCLDDDQSNDPAKRNAGGTGDASYCDTHVAANQPAQAITITAPSTIGVSPYSYSNGSAACPGDTNPSSPDDGVVQTGAAPNITCTVTVRNSSYILQAGPIFVLSPPTPN